MDDLLTSLRPDRHLADDFSLATLSTDVTRGTKRRAAERALDGGKLAGELAGHHDRLMAQQDQSVLLVLQGLDASGKGGTVRHVVGVMNPAGVRIAAFDEPTAEERSHHFLWRIRQHAPRAGQLVVFDRSHYEDLVVPQVEDALDGAALQRRINEVNRFEAELSDAGTTVVKCFLHMSPDVQRERFLRRLRRHDKRWKFKESDLDTRDQWDAYMDAYSTVIHRTHTSHAPWHIIPSDHKWYRNWAVAGVLAHTFRTLSLRYPQPDVDVAAVERRLAVTP